MKNKLAELPPPIKILLKLIAVGIVLPGIHLPIFLAIGVPMNFFF